MFYRLKKVKRYPRTPREPFIHTRFRQIKKLKIRQISSFSTICISAEEGTWRQDLAQKHCKKGGSWHRHCKKTAKNHVFLAFSIICILIIFFIFYHFLLEIHKDFLPDSTRFRSYKRIKISPIEFSQGHIFSKCMKNTPPWDFYKFIGSLYFFLSYSLW